MVLLEDYADAQEVEDIVLKQQEEAKATPNGEDGVGQQQEGVEADSDEGSTIKL